MWRDANELTALPSLLYHSSLLSVSCQQRANDYRVLQQFVLALA